MDDHILSMEPATPPVAPMVSKKRAHDETKTEAEDDRTLKYHLLGPSLTKAGQDKVDQSKVRCSCRP